MLGSSSMMSSRPRGAVMSVDLLTVSGPRQTTRENIFPGAAVGKIPTAGTRSGAIGPAASARGVDDEQDDRDHEQDPGDLARHRGDPGHPERPGHEPDEQEEQRIVEHRRP